MTTSRWGDESVSLVSIGAARPSTARALGVLQRIALAASAVLEMPRPTTRAPAELQTTELLAMFEASPEAHALPTNDAWPAVVLEHARSDLGATAATLSADLLHEVLFDIFPRNVSCDASAATDIVTELRAFFTYLDRELAFANAPECLAVLDEGASESLHDVLSDHTLFGVDKLDLMADREAIFDMMTAGTDA